MEVDPAPHELTCRNSSQDHEGQASPSSPLNSERKHDPWAGPPSPRAPTASPLSDLPDSPDPTLSSQSHVSPEASADRVESMAPPNSELADALTIAAPVRAIGDCGVLATPQHSSSFGGFGCAVPDPLPLHLQRVSVPPSPVVDPGSLHHLGENETPDRRHSSVSGIAGIDELLLRERLGEAPRGFDALLQATRNQDLRTSFDSNDVIGYFRLESKDGVQIFAKTPECIFGRLPPRIAQTISSVDTVEGTIVVNTSVGPCFWEDAKNKRAGCRPEDHGWKGQTRSSSGSTSTMRSGSSTSEDMISFIPLPFKTQFNRSLALDNKNISRKHARLAFNSKQNLYELEVFGRNGIFVNDQHYAAGSVVPITSSEHRIMIGAEEFTIYVPPQEQCAPLGKPVIQLKQIEQKFTFQDENGQEVQSSQSEDDNELYEKISWTDSSGLAHLSDERSEDDEESSEDGEESDGGESSDGEVLSRNPPLSFRLIVNQHCDVSADEDNEESSSDEDSSISDSEDDRPLLHHGTVRSGSNCAKIFGSRVAGQKTTVLQHEKEAAKFLEKRRKAEAARLAKQNLEAQRRKAEMEKKSKAEAEAIRKAERRRENDCKRKRLKEEKERQQALKKKANQATNKPKSQAVASEKVNGMYLPRTAACQSQSGPSLVDTESSVNLTVINSTVRPIMETTAIDPALFALGGGGSMVNERTAEGPKKAPKKPRAPAKTKIKKPTPPPQLKKENTPELGPDDFTEAEKAKPNKTYVIMIYECLAESKTGLMALPDIYAWIKNKYPFFRFVASDGWTSSVRHNLAQNPAFQKLQKAGKGWAWGLTGLSIEKETKKKHPTVSVPPRSAQLTYQLPHNPYANVQKQYVPPSGPPYVPPRQTQTPTPQVNRPIEPPPPPAGADTDGNVNTKTIAVLKAAWISTTNPEMRNLLSEMLKAAYRKESLEPYLARLDSQKKEQDATQPLPQPVLQSQAMAFTSPRVGCLPPVPSASTRAETTVGEEAADPIQSPVAPVLPSSSHASVLGISSPFASHAVQNPANTPAEISIAAPIPPPPPAYNKPVPFLSTSMSPSPTAATPSSTALVIPRPSAPIPAPPQPRRKLSPPIGVTVTDQQRNMLKNMTKQQKVTLMEQLKRMKQQIAQTGGSTGLDSAGNPTAGRGVLCMSPKSAPGQWVPESPSQTPNTMSAPSVRIQGLVSSTSLATIGTTMGVKRPAESLEKREGSPNKRIKVEIGGSEGVRVEHL